MNQRSTNRSFDAAMRLFKTRQRLEGGGVGENEGHRPTFGGVGGLALCAGFGLHGSEHDVAEAHGLVGCNGQRVMGWVAVGLEVGAISGNVGQAADAGEGGAGRGQHFGQQRLVTREGGDGGLAGVPDFGGRVAVHGGSKSGPIPAMSNPKPVTSDVSSPFGRRIMNGPIPYEPTPEGRAIAAAYKKRQEGK